MTMKAFETIFLILPAYKEAARIVNTVNEAVAYFEIKGLGYQIIVATDGDDGTRERAARMGLANSPLKAIDHVERRRTRNGIRRVVPMACSEITGLAGADNKTPLQNWLKSSIGLSKRRYRLDAIFRTFPALCFPWRPNLIRKVSK
jgi:glycosyltransferase involved in cell wall biosynthesis